MLHNKAFYKNAGGLARPLTKEELRNEIKIRLDRKQTNLNDIDTSKITDMNSLFYEFDFINKIDISLWDVSNVTNMDFMFGDCKDLNCDLSKWNVSKVKSMHGMFKNSKFDGDISKWNVSNVKFMSEMFKESKFNGDITKWNVSKVTNMGEMFVKSEFDDIRILSKWCPHIDVKYQHDVFDYSPLNGLDFKCFR